MAFNFSAVPVLRASFLVTEEQLEQKIRNLPSNSKSPQLFIDFLQAEQNYAIEDNVFFPIVTKKVSDLCAKVISHLQETNRLISTRKIDLKTVCGLEIEAEPTISKSRIFFVKTIVSDILKTNNSESLSKLNPENKELLRLIVSAYVDKAVLFASPVVTLVFDHLQKDQSSLLDGFYDSIACDYIQKSSNKGNLLGLEDVPSKKGGYVSGKGSSSNGCIVS